MSIGGSVETVAFHVTRFDLKIVSVSTAESSVTQQTYLRP